MVGMTPLPTMPALCLGIKIALLAFIKKLQKLHPFVIPTSPLLPQIIKEFFQHVTFQNSAS